MYAGKLQDASDKSKVSVWLEASRMMGGGHRVELRFEDGLKIKGSGEGDGGAGLFPGGIVGVKGRNVGGQFFNVNEIIMVCFTFLFGEIAWLIYLYLRCLPFTHLKALPKTFGRVNTESRD